MTTVAMVTHADRACFSAPSHAAAPHEGEGPVVLSVGRLTYIVIHQRMLG